MGAKYLGTKVPLQDGVEVMVYASPRVKDALYELTRDMTLYKGVRFSQVLEAVYEQGKKDGARNVFDVLDGSLGQAKAEIPHRKPGRPRKK